MTEPWKQEKLYLCRCCHTEGQAHTSLQAKCFWLGDQEEAYDKVLKDCFDIQLEPVSNLIKELLSTICNKCIERLRDATIFKHQIKKCERMFRKIYMGQFNNGEVSTEVNIKDEQIEDSDDEVIRAAIETIPDVGEFNESEGNADDDDYALPSDDDEPLSCKKAKVTPRKYTKKKIKKNMKEETSTEKNDGNEEKAKSNPGNKRPKIPVKEGTDYRRVARDSTVVLQCCSCDKKYELKQLQNLRIHIRHVHKKKPRHCCKYCGKGFSHEGSYTVHKLVEHNVDEGYKCTACDGKYSSRSHLIAHVKNFHMLGKKRKCDMCEYVAYSNDRLVKHKQKHKTVKDFHCSYCNKSFVRKTTLQFHERIHTGDKRKVCKECGQAFVQKASLNYHMAKHHPGVDF